MYNIGLLKTVEQCRTVMERAKKLGDDDLYRKLFIRSCEISGRSIDDPSDPVVVAFYETLAAYEHLLSEKNGRNQQAGRTRQKVNRKGVRQTLIDWTMQDGRTAGFETLVAKGLYQYTGEFIVARFASEFPEDAVERAKQVLTKHNIPIPDPE